MLALTRRDFLQRAGAVAAGLAATGRADAQQAAQPFNILLLVADDLGSQLGCLGTPGLATPHIDGLARRGLTFTHTFCGFPSCSPARTSLMTGLYPHRHNTIRNVHEHFGPRVPADWPTARHAHNAPLAIPTDAPTLVEILRAAGWHTSITSKFHMWPHARFPFDAWSGGNAGADVARLLGEAGERPFFLMHNLRSPHRPFRQFINQRRGGQIIDPAQVVVPAYLPDTELMRRDWAEYLTACAITDDQVGEALAVLQASGRADRTLVIFTGDNGPSFHRGKYSDYDFGLRVPLILSGPEVPQGRFSRSLASHVDLLPTLLEWLGLPLPAGVQGHSLAPVLADPAAQVNPQIVGEVVFGAGVDRLDARGMSDGRYHYVRRSRAHGRLAMPADNTDEQPWGNHSYQATIDAREAWPEPYRLLQVLEDAPAEELFDLHADPWCQRDVLAAPNHRAAATRLRLTLDAWIAATGDSAMAAG